MRKLIIIILGLISVAYGQKYQSMPQAGYGPVKRMQFDSVVTLPMGITRLRNLSDGRDSGQVRYNPSDSSLYVYTGSTWVRQGGGGGGGAQGINEVLAVDNIAVGKDLSLTSSSGFSSITANVSSDILNSTLSITPLNPFPKGWHNPRTSFSELSLV